MYRRASQPKGCLEVRQCDGSATLPYVKLRLCERCGKPLTTKDPRTHFCGGTCARLKAWPDPSKPCETCGKLMIKSTSRVADWKAWEKRRFCSKRCMGDSYRRPKVACPNCGKLFHPVITKSTVFCSRACYQAYRVGKARTPANRLASVRKRSPMNFTPSQKKRLLALARGCCRKCGSTENLEFDHVIPIRAGGLGTIANGQVLCTSCHLAKTRLDH